MIERTKKPPTLQDVAVALGTTKSAVSQALSGKGNTSPKTRARILAAAREMGYEPNPLAQRLASGYQNDQVCLFTGILDTGIATQKVLLIQQDLSLIGMEAPIYAGVKVVGDAAADGPARSQAAQIKQLRRQRPRAIICAAQVNDPRVFAELDAYRHDGGLLVSYDTPSSLECDQVIFDREDNAYRAARHLLEMGHRKIGLAISRSSGLPTGSQSDPQTHRLRGFQRALEEFDVPMREEWLFRNAPYEKGGQEMAQAFLLIPPSERPTGLCIVNDYVALAFMAEVIQAGVRIPQDLSVMGHDNQPIAAFCPVPLTTMTQPTEQIADTVVTLLRERLQGTVATDSPPRTVRIQGELVTRASIASPSA